MDKLKEQLAVFKTHGFWIMCALILLVSLIGWYFSTSSVAERHGTQLTAITNVFRQMDSLRQQNQKHPNASTAAGMDALTRAYAAEVEKGWSMQYKQQEKVLVWPASFDAEFRDAVDKLRPIEIIKPQNAITDELPLELRQMYRNYIEVDLPTLAKTIGAGWQASSRGTIEAPVGPPSLDGTTRPAENNSVVIWLPENQQQLLLTHFGFITGDVPLTLQILYAQEDLWVLQNIMNIIKATNGDATARHEAVIKQIDYVRIGRSALGLAGQVTVVGTPGVSGLPDPTATGGIPPGENAPPPPTGGENGLMAAGGDPAAAITADPASGRYVDEKYQPLDPTRLRNALVSREESEALLAVAKRIPVRLRFRLDQRKLNVLLAECGNARLPIEIRQMRINPDKSSTGGAAAAASTGGDGDDFSNRPVNRTMVSDATVDPTLIDVEMYGVVYIYNPVNRSQLGLEGAPVTAGVPAPVTPPVRRG